MQGFNRYPRHLWEIISRLELILAAFLLIELIMTGKLDGVIFAAPTSFAVVYLGERCAIKRSREYSPADSKTSKPNSVIVLSPLNIRGSGGATVILRMDVIFCVLF